MATNGSPPPADAAVSNGGGVSSPQSRRRSLHSPWASVVRGDSEQNPSPTAAAATAAVSPGFSSSPPVEETSVSDNSLIESPGSEPQPESSENNGEHNAGGQRRPAWNRPVNGVVEPVSFMVGASWPTLSETIRSVPRSASESVSNGSSPSQRGDKVRKRIEWNKWLLSVVNSDSSAQASSSTVVATSTSAQEVSMDDPIAHVYGNVDAREAHADESTSHHGLVNGDNTEEVHSAFNVF